MNENKQMDKCNQTMEAPKVKKTYSVKNYRAFLVNALNFQAEQYQQWEKYEDLKIKHKQNLYVQSF